MDLVQKIKEINWKLTSSLMSVPFITDAIHHVYEGKYNYIDQGEFIELGLETLLLGGIGVYISKKSNEQKAITKELEIEHSLLSKRDELFHELSKNVPGMIYQFKKNIDVSYCVPFTTNYIEEIFGCKASDVKNTFEPIQKAIHPDDLDKVIKSINISAKNLTTWECEYRIQLPNQPIRWLWGKSTPEKLDDGSILWNGFNNDITERKQMEQTINENNELFELFIKHTPIYTYIKEVNQNSSQVLYASENFEKMIGIPGSKMKGKTMEELFSLDFAKKIIEDDKKIISKGELVTLEEEMNGSYYKTRKFPIINGNKTFIAGFTIDITERTIADNKLKESEIKYRNLIDITGTGYLILDMQGKVIDANQEYVRISGHDNLEDIIGRSVVEWTSDESKEKNTEAILSCLNEGFIRDLIIEYKDKNGKITPVEINATVYLNNDTLQIISLCRDITNRVNIEKTLMETELSSRVGDMAFEVAHDFNNILTIITGNAHMALMEPNLTSELSQYINNINENVFIASERIRILQQFSNNNNNNYNPININDLIDRSIVQTRPYWKNSAEKKGIKIDIEKNYGKISIIDANYGELSNVFFNLIKNSVESMDNNGKIIFETEDNNQNGIYIRIKDTGRGMTEETKNKIFDKGYTTKNYTTGHGFGMSGVIKTINAHNGEIQVKESKINIGTTIEILLPYGKLNIKNTKEVNTPKNISAKILWVDDEEGISLYGKSLLKKLGYETDTANSGAQALEKLATAKYDLVITDIGMPTMNGWQLIEESRKLYGNNQFAVVSGWGNNLETEKEQYKVNNVIGKPFKPEQIQNLINEIIKKNK